MTTENADNNLDLEARLKSADPAKRFRGKPSPDLLTNAVAVAKERETGIGRVRNLGFRFQNSMQRSLAIGGAAVLALALVVPTALSVGGKSPLIQVAISEGRGGAMENAQSSKIAGDQMMACLGCGAFGGYQYDNAGLSDSGGSGHIYQMVAKGTVSELGSLLSDEFNFPGKLNKSNAEGDYYYFGDTDPFAPAKEETSNNDFWSKPQVVVYWNSSNPSWNYNDPNAYVQYVCPGDPVSPEGRSGSSDGSSSGSSEAVPPTSAPVEPGTEPAPCTPVIPKDAKPISVSAAKQTAISLFRKLGYEVGTGAKHTSADYLMVSVRADEWNITVNGNLVVEGFVTNQMVSLNWDVRTGKLAYAGGMFSSAKDMGGFPLISPAAALPRLSHFAWAGDFYADWDNFKYSENLNGGMVVLDDRVKTSEGAVPEPGVATSEPAEDPNPPVQETPKPVVIKVSKSQITLMGIWATDGTSWLVPGYLFFDDSGYVGNSLAVAEGVVALPNYDDSVVQPMTK